MPLPRPDAVLFDLDGTLLDTLDDIAIILDRALVAHGHAALPPGAAKTMVGDGARTLVTRALARVDSVTEPHEVSAVLASYLALYEADPTPATVVMPFAIELLDALAARRIVAVVCTNKPGAIARPVVARALGGRVHATIGAGDVPQLKPHRAPVDAALRAAGVAHDRAAHAWMVGDGDQDVEAAHAAGVPAIAYRGGYGDPEKLRAAGAALYVDSFAELIALLSE